MVSLAELPVGAEAYSGQPEDLAEVITPLVSAPETISTADFGGSRTDSQNLADTYSAYYAAQAAEEAQLRQYQANQQQAQWAEEQTQTTFTEDLAQTYVDFYEGDTTTAQLLTDPVAVINPIGIIPDVLGTDIIAGSITAAGAVLDPITKPLGEGLGNVVLPAVIIGGAILLLK
tara:strand:+ start:19 stop:540 length:522 start_codon:yes stop_codon:yes gene_type:complete